MSWTDFVNTEDMWQSQPIVGVVLVGKGSVDASLINATNYLMPSDILHHFITD